MTINGIVEGISAKIMTDSARIMINSAKIMTDSARIMITSARFMTISASSEFTLRFLEHPPPPVHAARADDGRDIH